MKSVWSSIRSAVTLFLVVAFCVLVIWVTVTGKLEAKDAIIALGGPVSMTITFYFAGKKRKEGEE